MRPSISVTLEPGLDRGVPWGRDLYTFVTSAAGHMMRTLQKPRKNRPSKRQVNHRRFLHNMIQRKFADIEAANHRLASALYFKEDEKNSSSLPSQKPETLDQSGSSSQGVFLQDPDKCSVHTGADGSGVSIDSHESEIREKKQPDLGQIWKRQPKSQPATCTTRKNNQSKGGKRKESRNHKLVEFTPMTSSTDYNHGAELFHTEYYDDESLLKLANNPSDDSQSAQQGCAFIHDISPVFSPGLSPLPLDSYDFSIQMFTDVSTCTQTQRNITDISESQWTDIMDLLNVGNKDLGGCMDVEAYFESICACQGDAGQRVDADDVADQSDSFSEVEHLHCGTGEFGYSCHGDQGLTINHFQSVLRQGIIQNQLPTSISYDYDTSELQMYQHSHEQSPCMLLNNHNFTPFDGVAQSFSVPLLTPEHRPIPTPPREDDWLFTDILKDRKSPDC